MERSFDGRVPLPVVVDSGGNDERLDLPRRLDSGHPFHSVLLRPSLMVIAR